MFMWPSSQFVIESGPCKVSHTGMRIDGYLYFVKLANQILAGTIIEAGIAAHADNKQAAWTWTAVICQVLGARALASGQLLYIGL